MARGTGEKVRDMHNVEIEVPDKRCKECGGLFKRCHHGNVCEEIAEVVRNAKHVLVHVSCMKEGEQVA